MCGGGGGTDSGDSGCPGPAAAGGPDPSQPRGGEPGWRAAGGQRAGSGRAGERAAFVPVGLLAKGTRWRAGPGSSRPGGWRSGAAGLKVRQAAGRARGGLRAAPWLGAPWGLPPRPLPAAADEAGPPVRPGRSSPPGGPFSLGPLQLFVARWCPWLVGFGLSRGRGGGRGLVLLQQISLSWRAAGI